jgi:hypothetical protein
MLPPTRFLKLALMPLSPRDALRLLMLVSSPQISGFTQSGRLAAPKKCNEAETGSLALGLIRSQSKSLHSFASHHNGGDRPASPARLPSHGGPLLRDERAIITADSFQSASRTRLGLALQIHVIINWRLGQTSSFSQTMAEAIGPHPSL